MSVPPAIAKKHVLFVGNPGVGKSTLLNCLMLTRTKTNGSTTERFPSGVTFGSRMTYKLDEKVQESIVYMDTPGLSDLENRKQAATAITEALKKDGEYQVVFVLTLESGRVRPDDVTTMTLVLESAKDIEHYGVVFNKIGHAVILKLTIENAIVLMSKISLQNTFSKPLPIPLFLELEQELSDQNDRVIKLPKLDEFINSLPVNRIHKNYVNEIPTDTYEARKEKLEKELTALREDNALLQKKLKADREAFRRKIEENPNKFKNLVGMAAKILILLTITLLA